MDIFLIIAAIIWLIGWINELIFMEVNMKKHGISFPSNEVKYIAPIVLFFTWPYFYIYGKNL